MNDQTKAILETAIAELATLEASQQTDVDTASASVAAANAELAARQGDLATTKNVSASLQALVNPPAPAPAPEG